MTRFVDRTGLRRCSLVPGLLVAIAMAPAARGGVSTRGPTDDQLVAPPASDPATEPEPELVAPPIVEASPTTHHQPLPAPAATSAPQRAADRLRADPVGYLADTRAARVSLDLLAGTLASCAGGGACFLVGTTGFAILLAAFPSSFGLATVSSADRIGSIAVLAPAAGTALLPFGVAAAGLAWHRDLGSVVGAVPTVMLGLAIAVITVMAALSPTAVPMLILGSIAALAVAPVALAMFEVGRALAAVGRMTATGEQTTPAPFLPPAAQEAR